MMKVARVDLLPSSMPKEDPEWRYALGASATAEGIVVRITSEDGIVGLGYTGAGAHWDPGFGGVQTALELYAELLIDQDAFALERISELLDGAPHGSLSAKAAIDIALHDLQARALNIPVCDLLGGVFRTEVDVIRIMALKEPLEMAKVAYGHIEQGYSYLKIKVGDDPEKDVLRVKEIRAAVGEGVHLTVDVNQQYSPKQAIDILNRMGEYGIELAEQPVPADDWQGLAVVRGAVDCMVEAHEAASSVEAVFGLVRDGVVDSINLGLSAMGGLRNAKVAAGICRVGNVSCRVPSIGSRVLAAASMHFVASTPNISYACELGEFSRFLNDPATGLEVRNGKLHLPEGPGLGIELVA